MMKKTALWAGFLIVLLLVLGMTGAAGAAAPTKSAAEWQNEGCTVVSLSDTDAPADGFLVLDRDVAYLKETKGDGISRSGNTFTLSEGKYTQVGAQNGEPSRYCVLSGGKLYFGIRNGNSADGALVLDRMVRLDLDCLTLNARPEKPQGSLLSRQDADKFKEVLSQANQGKKSDAETADAVGKIMSAYQPATPYTLGAWIDWPIDVDIHETEKYTVPLDLQGKVHVFMDHWAESEWAYNNDTLRVYFDADFDEIGLHSTEKVTATAVTVPLYDVENITVFALEILLEDYIGDINMTLKSHYGYTVTWKSSFVAMWDFDAAYDSDCGTTCDIVEMDATGEIGLEFALGPQINLDFLEIFKLKLGWTIDFGLLSDDADQPARFSPPDTMINWHVCNECVHEELRPVAGPGDLYIEIESIGLDEHWYTDKIKFDPFYDYYWSNTFGDWGEGPCPHYGYRLDVTARDQDGKPLRDVAVSYETVPEHYSPQSTGTTSVAGLATIYPPAGSITLKADLVSKTIPGQSQHQTKTLMIKNELNQAGFRFNIPKKHVRFKNPASGEAVSWPEDIDFQPFYTESVKLPDTIPGLSGRQFVSWNTAEDGSGTSYAPGTQLTLTDDLTLWAQWRIPENVWFVIYNANGGTKAPGPQEVPLGEDAVLSRDMPEAGKMIFKGWTPDLKKMSPVYRPGDTLKYDSRKNYVVLNALWDLSPVPEPIHISFEANGLQEAVLPPDVWFEQGSWLQLRPAEPAFGSAWSFVGWSENPHAADPEFPAGRSYYFYRDTVLYAIWKKADTVTLTFRDPLPDPVKGLPNPITILPSMSRDVKIPSGIPEKAGRVFTGWNTAKDGSGKQLAPGSVITLTEDTTIWAQWKIAADSWYVIYDANGGRRAPVAQEIPKGTDAVLTRELPDGGVMVFRGWTTDLSKPDPEYQPGNTLKYDSSRSYVVLHALWDLSPEGRPVVVTFHANGGRQDTVPHAVSAPKMTWFLLPEEEPLWDRQHEFLGWSRDPEAVKAEMAPGGMAVFGQDTKLFAVWRARYRVTEGAGSVWTKGSGKTQRFAADGNITYFTEFRIDGKRFEDGVKITSGSTVAEISPQAMEKLSVGIHTVTFAYEDGEASARFTVQPNIPPTGDAEHPLLWGILILLGLAGLALSLKRTR